MDKRKWALVLLTLSLCVLVALVGAWDRAGSDPLVALLRSQPEVVQVEVLVAPPRPTLRIIHVRDRRYVPCEEFAAGRPLTDQQQDYLNDVERVQREQAALLHRLFAQHALPRRVFLEGVTPSGV